MLATLFLLLILFWFLNYIQIEGFHIPQLPVFMFHKVFITLWDILIFFVATLSLLLLPTLIRIFLVVMIFVWTLATLGLLVVGIFPLADILVLVMIIGIIIVLLSPNDSV